MDNREKPWRYAVAVCLAFAVWLGGGFLGRGLAPFAEVKPGEAFNNGLFCGFIVAAAGLLAACAFIATDEEKREGRRKKAEEETERLMHKEGLR